MFAHKAIVPVVDAQDELQKMVANTKEVPPEVVIDQTLVDRISDLAHAEMQQVMTVAEKHARRDRKKELKARVKEELASDYEGREKEIAGSPRRA